MTMTIFSKFGRTFSAVQWSSRTLEFLRRRYRAIIRLWTYNQDAPIRRALRGHKNRAPTMAATNRLTGFHNEPRSSCAQLSLNCNERTRIKKQYLAKAVIVRRKRKAVDDGAVLSCRFLQNLSSCRRFCEMWMILGVGTPSRSLSIKRSTQRSRGPTKNVTICLIKDLARCVR